MFKLEPPMTSKYTVIKAGGCYKICKIVEEGFKTEKEAVNEILKIMDKEFQEIKEEKIRKRLNELR